MIRYSIIIVLLLVKIHTVKATCPLAATEWVYPFKYIQISSSNTDKNSLQIFTWTKSEFDPQKPTLLYVTGGPGESAHQVHFDLPGWNTLFFDMRGIACSQWSNKSFINDPRLYSSALVAEDMEAIRQAYQIKKWSIYATSYGTIPATIYAHKFGHTLNQLILEGTVFEGGPRLISSQRLKFLLQSFFNQLPIPHQNKILSLSQELDINPHWFSAAGLMMLYLDSSFTAFNGFLDEILFIDKNPILLNSFIRIPHLSNNDLNFSTRFMAMIGCQELGLDLVDIGPYFKFENKQLVPSSFSPYRDQLCQTLLPSKSSPSRLYSALQYPAKVSITYIQGEHDGATTADHAFLHYKNWARGFKRILVAKNGGHLPLSGNLSSNFIELKEKQIKYQVLSSILSYDEKLLSQLDTLSKLSEIKWKIIQ